MSWIAALFAALLASMNPTDCDTPAAACASAAASTPDATEAEEDDDSKRARPSRSRHISNGF